MLPEDYNYNKTYISYVQNQDDFYNQLRAFEQEHNLIDQTVDENTDLTMAQEMLQAIGIATK
jgi:hypothetical protein